MDIELPSAIQTYLDAVNARNPEALNACLVPDARVNDSGEEQIIDGLESIKGWFLETCAQYKLHVDISAAQIDGDEVKVALKASGDFPGSPLPFEYRFRLAGGYIAGIDIIPKETNVTGTLASRSVMSPAEIMAALSVFDYKLPEAALYAAEARPEAVTPLLLAELQRYAAGKPDSSKDGSTLVLYGMFLLARFREIRALTHLGHMLDKFPGDDDLLEPLGLFENGPRILASLAFSKPQALRPFIENASYYEAVRGDALEANIALWLNGAVGLEDMREYLRHLAEDVLVRESDGRDRWVWYAWARCCIIFGFDEWYPLIKTAFEEEWIDPMISDWDHEEKDIAKGREYILEGARKACGNLVGHVADEMRGWYCFTEQARQDEIEHEAKWKRDRAKRERERRDEQGEQPEVRDNFAPVGTIVNDKPKPKPNQPCPCGSGKKYKKCCGR